MGSEVPMVRLYDPAEWTQDLTDLRQNSLLDESTFINFAGERGIPVHGVIEGDPGVFHRKGWLHSDDRGYDGKPLFHPFRVYPLKKILDACDLHISRSASLQRCDAIKLFAMMLSNIPSDETIRDEAAQWNNIAELAILLEPLYWPALVGRIRTSMSVPPSARQDRFDDYRSKVLAFLKELDPNRWKALHACMRREAAAMDDNPELYILLRTAHWESRGKVSGSVAGSLWIRHIAEVLRRGFEEAHGEQWPEEYQSYMEWFPTGVEFSFGSTRPLDDILRTQPYAVHNFGISSGSKVRWYVEGETEYYAIRELLREPATFGIELINLRGVIAADRDNIALKFGDWLREDQRHHRFSILSVDTDVAKNSRFIGQHIRDGNIVGYIGVHQPDFEIANFTVPELVELAAKRDEADGIPTTNLRCADWSTITGARAFEDQYRRFSGRNLKGELWGKILATFARATPLRPDTGHERPLICTARIALQCRTAHYDIEKEYFGFDPSTFERIRTKPYPPYIAGA
jgi:hypothetical protein